MLEKLHGNWTTPGTRGASGDQRGSGRILGDLGGIWGDPGGQTHVGTHLEGSGGTGSPGVCSQDQPSLKKAA